MSDTIPAPHTHRVTLLIAIVGVLVASYSLWRVDNTRDREDATRDRVQLLENSNAALRVELNASIDSEAKERAEFQKQWQQIAELPQQVKDLTASHDDLRARTERPQRAWSRAEALYLIELAQRRLSFDRDTATAIAALESADSRLASLRDPTFASVRQQIAKNLQALRAVPEPDRAGTVERIAAIEAQSDLLGLKGVLVGQRAAQSTEGDVSSTFARAWTSVTNTFSSMFVVRHLHDGDGAIVSLEEQALRRQHFTLLAFTARHSIMRNDQAGYRAALDAMRSWIAQYFVESPVADSITKELKSLSEIDIAPPLPDISHAAEQLMRAAPAP
jgi:uroporphyrin-3 C-methyltransferase